MVKNTILPGESGQFCLRVLDAFRANSSGSTHCRYEPSCGLESCQPGAESSSSPMMMVIGCGRCENRGGPVALLHGRRQSRIADGLRDRRERIWSHDGRNRPVHLRTGRVLVAGGRRNVREMRTSGESRMEAKEEFSTLRWPRTAPGKTQQGKERPQSLLPLLISSGAYFLLLVLDFCRLVLRANHRGGEYLAKQKQVGQQSAQMHRSIQVVDQLRTDGRLRQH